ncbi:AAA family ATPase [Gelidibacter japonicus]|uniref:AAA family ATPase n=1 Tax=Gelidibacter japonicus TaxID=1962232 RepID=UPI003A93C638
MIISIFIKNFKIYKGINFIPISEGENFSSLIGENGVGKSSVLEALDFSLNGRNGNEWPVNNEAKNEGGLKGTNAPYLTPVFLIKKTRLNQEKKDEIDFFNKAEKLSNYLWYTKKKTKAKGLSEFYEQRKQLLEKYNPEEYFLIIIGRKYDSNDIYFGTYHTYLDFIIENPSIEHTEKELQDYFKGFYDYIISHYSYLYIPVETDVHSYTKLETQEMQKLMDKNIQSEIENAITSTTIKQINKSLNEFVLDIENVLEEYKYKGKFKNSLTMPDLVSKIIEAYFSIKILHKKTSSSKLIPVRELSSGEKRKALIDVAYSFLLNNNSRNDSIILAIDEPEASLHISACYSQFEKIINLSKLDNQIIISTHWYGYLPIVSNGNATSITKNDKNETLIQYFNLYNYREKITQDRSKVKGPLPVHYNIKSYNDLVQSILFSLIQDNPYNWIVCEGLSEKIYFEQMFSDEIKTKNLRFLPLGSFKEVKKLYSLLLAPIQDPDYQIKGKVLCLIDTDAERVDIDFSKTKNLFFKRLMNDKTKGSTIIDVDSNITNPPTEIEDCLNPYIYKQTLIEFSEEYETIKNIITNNEIRPKALNSYYTFDLRESEKEDIKAFFDDKQGYNKIRFAEKYSEISKTPFFGNEHQMEWIENIRKLIN